MLQKLKNKIENKRDNKDVFSRSLISFKDSIWKSKILLGGFFLDRPTSEKIEFVNFAVTYRCNSRCKTCNIWKKYHKNPKKIKEEMSLDDIKKVFSSKYLKNLNSISFTGGEPFLRKDFDELVEFFIEKYPKLHIAIPTNAINLKLILLKLEKIMKSNPERLEINVSLDGIGKTHDKIRGIKGNYGKAIKLIENVKKKFPEIKIGMGFTIIPENYKELLKVYELSKKKGVGFGFWFGQLSDFFYENVEKVKDLGWDNEKFNEIDEMIKIIVKDMEKRGKIDFFGKYYHLNMINFQKNPERKIKCYSGTHSFFLDPYGYVYPCIVLDKLIGNVKYGFDKVWMSKKARKVRKSIKNKKCSCWAGCEISSSLTKNMKLILRMN
jgi:radical SAM protein with 4Fe4S-binding SPASM domain